MVSLPPEKVEQWLAELKSAGIAKTAKQGAALLEISETSMSLMRKKGVTGDTSHRTALAMAAIIAGIEPYA